MTESIPEGYRPCTYRSKTTLDGRCLCVFSMGLGFDSGQCPGPQAVTRTHGSASVEGLQVLQPEVERVCRGLGCRGVGLRLTDDEEWWSARTQSSLEKNVRRALYGLDAMGLLLSRGSLMWACPLVGNTETHTAFVTGGQFPYRLFAFDHLGRIHSPSTSKMPEAEPKSSGLRRELCGIMAQNMACGP